MGISMKQLLDAAEQWLRIINFNSVVNLGHEESDLYHGAEVLARENYIKLLRDYYADEAQAATLQSRLEKEIDELMGKGAL
jgi:hypothetical protein